MFFDFIRRPRAGRTTETESLQLGSRTVPLLVVRNPRARRYLLRLQADGTARVTIPRGGSRSEAQSFIERNRRWLEQQVERLHSQPRLPQMWQVGSEILLQGEWVRIEPETFNIQHSTPNTQPTPADCQSAIQQATSLRYNRTAYAGLGVQYANASAKSLSLPVGGAPTKAGELLAPSIHTHVRFGTEILKVNDASADLRPAIERHLRSLAQAELPARVTELAALHQLPVRRVSVRNQRSRWGSCSRHGVISLNWRLVQTPVFVRDYIILHELAHLRQMNHSDRFWREVERLCPDYLVAEKWLKTNRQLLR